MHQQLATESLKSVAGLPLALFKYGNAINFDVVGGRGLSSKLHRLCKQSVLQCLFYYNGRFSFWTVLNHNTNRFTYKGGCGTSKLQKD